MPRETRTCPICWTQFTPAPRGRQIYCSKKCCGAAYERRGRHRGSTPKLDSHTPEPQAAPQPAAIRCCPHCGQPITIVALLTTPEAARPPMPQAAHDTVIPLHRTTI